MNKEKSSIEINDTPAQSGLEVLSNASTLADIDSLAKDYTRKKRKKRKIVIDDDSDSNPQQAIINARKARNDQARREFEMTLHSLPPTEKEYIQWTKIMIVESEINEINNKICTQMSHGFSSNDRLSSCVSLENKLVDAENRHRELFRAFVHSIEPFGRCGVLLNYFRGT